ncbi:MAG: hypothetical protein KAI02_05200 [Gammaproteobacteria bacterium]|nr:hypothetical protein [Gammaproteobacteria bacterium]
MAHYNLVFQGKVIEGASVNQVKLNLAQLFKMSTTKVEHLFSGKPVNIKKNIDTQLAKKYLLIFKKAGAIVKAIKVQEPKAKASHNQNVIQLPNIEHLTLSDAHSGSLEKFSTVVKAIKLPDISYLKLLQHDNTPLSSHSPKPTAIKLPDISNLSIAEPQEGTLQDLQKKPVIFKSPDISNLSISEAQEGTLQDLQKKPVIFKSPDISHLTMTDITSEQAAPSNLDKAVFQIN